MASLEPSVNLNLNPIPIASFCTLSSLLSSSDSYIHKTKTTAKEKAQVKIATLSHSSHPQKERKPPPPPPPSPRAQQKMDKTKKNACTKSKNALRMQHTQSTNAKKKTL
jgi:hypothetical protein